MKNRDEQKISSREALPSCCVYNSAQDNISGTFPECTNWLLRCPADQICKWIVAVAKLILPDAKMYKNCLANSLMKQKGLCLQCKRTINLGDRIVSNGKKTKYYHESCARKVMILAD